MLSRFNGHLKSVLLRVSEARDLGEFDRYRFYDHTKVLLAAPPDMLRIDEKGLLEYYVSNVVGIEPHAVTAISSQKNGWARAPTL